MGFPRLRNLREFQRLAIHCHLQTPAKYFIGVVLALALAFGSLGCKKSETSDAQPAAKPDTGDTKKDPTPSEKQESNEPDSTTSTEEEQTWTEALLEAHPAIVALEKLGVKVDIASNSGLLRQRPGFIDEVLKVIEVLVKRIDPAKKDFLPQLISFDQFRDFAYFSSDKSFNLLKFSYNTPIVTANDFILGFEYLQRKESVRARVKERPGAPVLSVSDFGMKASEIRTTHEYLEKLEHFLDKNPTVREVTIGNGTELSVYGGKKGAIVSFPVEVQSGFTNLAESAAKALEIRGPVIETLAKKEVSIGFSYTYKDDISPGSPQTQAFLRLGKEISDIFTALESMESYLVSVEIADHDTSSDLKLAANFERAYVTPTEEELAAYPLNLTMRAVATSGEIKEAINQFMIKADLRSVTGLTDSYPYVSTNFDIWDLKRNLELIWKYKDHFIKIRKYPGVIRVEPKNRTASQANQVTFLDKRKCGYSIELNVYGVPTEEEFRKAIGLPPL